MLYYARSSVCDCKWRTHYLFLESVEEPNRDTVVEYTCLSTITVKEPLGHKTRVSGLDWSSYTPEK